MSERMHSMFYLLKGCPLKPDIPHQIEFQNESKQIEYFAQFDKLNWDDWSIISRQDNRIIVNVEGDLDELSRYSYGWYINNDINVNCIYFYVMACYYVNSRVIEMELIVDSWQTYHFDIIPSVNYIQRRTPINGETRNELELMDWVEEDIDTGKDYVLVQDIKTQNYIPAENQEDYSICIFSNVDLTADNGTSSAPRIVSSGGCVTDGIYSPQDIYIVSTGSYAAFIDALKDYPWVIQNFTKIIMFPTKLINQSGIEDIKMWNSGGNLVKRMKRVYASPVVITGEFETNFNYAPQYNKLRGMPFCYGELTDLNGSVLTFDLRGFAPDNKLKYRVDTSFCFNPEVRFTVTNYLNNYSQGTDFPRTLTDYSLSNTNWVEISTMVDGYQLAKANSEYTRNASLQNLNQSTELERFNNTVGSISSAVGSISTDPLRMVGGLASTATNYFVKEHSITANNEMQKRSLNAQTNQLKTTPPSLTGGFPQNSFLLTEKLLGWHFRIRQCRNEYMDKAVRFFNTTGCSINDYLTLDIHANRATYADYWQSIGANIRANIPRFARQDIENLLNSGLNVWHGTIRSNYDLTNNYPV